jgi:hypothetical protein
VQSSAAGPAVVLVFWEIEDFRHSRVLEKVLDGRHSVSVAVVLGPQALVEVVSKEQLVDCSVLPRQG